MFYIIHLAPSLQPCARHSYISHPIRVCLSFKFTLTDISSLFETPNSRACPLTLVWCVPNSDLVKTNHIHYWYNCNDSDNRVSQGHPCILRTRVHVSAEQSCYYLGIDFPLGKDWVRYDWIRVCGEYCQPEWAEWGVNRIINDGDEERHELSWWEWELFTGPTPPPDTSELCQSVHTEIDTL